VTSGIGVLFGGVVDRTIGDRRIITAPSDAANALAD
jgi:hypothetical protein